MAKLERIEAELGVKDMASAAANAVAEAMEKAAAAYDKSDQVVRRSTPSFDQINRKIDENARLTARLEKINRDYQQSVEVVVAAAEREGLKQAEIEEKIRRLTIARDAAVAAAQRQAQQMAQQFTTMATGVDSIVAAATKAATLSQQINQQMRIGSESDYAQRAADIASYGEELDRLRAKYNPMFAAQQRYTAELTNINQALKVGAINEIEAANARSAATRSYQQFVQSFSEGSRAVAGNAESIRVPWMFLFANLQDGFNQLIAGGSPLVAFAQQGPKMFQIVATSAGGARQAIAMVGAAIASNAIPIAIAAVAAAVMALVAASDLQERNLVRLRDSLRSITTDYKAAADTMEEQAKRMARATPGLSRSDAQTSLLTIAQAPSGMTSSVAQLTQDLRDLAKTVAGDLAGASEMMVKLFRNPADIVAELSEKRVPGFNERLREMVERMAATGDRAGAVEEVLRRLRQQYSGSTEDLSPLQQAWRGLSHELGVLWSNISDGLSGAGARLIVWMEGLVRLLNSAVELIPSLSRRVDAPPLKPGEQLAAAGNDFRNALGDAESGNNYTLVNQYGYTGRYQFGTARLAALGLYQRAPGESLDANQWRGQITIPGFEPMTQEQFRNNIAAQEAAMTAQIADLDRKIATLTVNGQAAVGSGYQIAGIPLNQDGLRAVGHMYPSLLQQFIDSNGVPLRRDGTPYRDGNGTTPLDYYKAFSNVPGVTINTPTVEVAGPSGQGGQPPATTVGGQPPATTVGGQPVAAQGQTDSDVLMRYLRMARGREDWNLPSVPYERAERINSYLGTIDQILPQAQSRGEREALLEFQRKLRAELEATKSPYDQYLENLQRQRRLAEQASPEQEKLTKAMQDFDEAMQKAGVQPTQEQRQAVMAEHLRTISAEFRKASDEIDRQVAGQDRLQEAYHTGAEAVAEAQAREQAIAEVRKMGIAGIEAQQAAIDELAKKYRRLSAEQADTISAQQALTNRQQLALVGVDQGAITGDAVTRAVLNAQARTAQQILNRNGNLNSRDSQDLLRTTEELTRAQLETQRLQSAWDDLQRIGTQAFDRIGEAITQAFAQGKIEAIDFGNIGKAVLSELVQGFLRLAVINPLKNLLFGGNSGSLGDIFSLLSGSGSSGSVINLVGSGGQVLGTLSSASSALALSGGGGGFAGFGNVGNVIGGLFTALGFGQAASAGGLMQALGIAGSSGSILQNLVEITGISDALSGIGNYLGLTGSSFGSIGNTITGFLNTPLYTLPFGQGALQGGFYAGTALPGEAGNFVGGGAANMGTIGSTIGGAAGVLGGAYGIYSGIQKGGVGGAVGAAGGALSMIGGAGALTGLFSIGPAGWIASAVLSILGALLPGQKPSNREGNATIDFSTDMITIDGQTGKKFSQANREMANNMISGVSEVISKVETLLNATATGRATIGVGDRDGIYATIAGSPWVGRYDRNEAGVRELMRDLTVNIVKSSMTDMTETVARAVQGIRVDSIENALTDIVTISEATNQGRSSVYQDIASRNLDFVGDFQGSIEQLKWVTNTYEKLINDGWKEGLSSFKRSLQDLADNWEPVIKNAQALGLATEELTEAWNQQKAELQEARDLNVATTLGNLRARILQASGEEEDTKAAQLLLFDLQAQQEALNLRNQLRDLAVTSAEAAEMTDLLTQAQALERQAIIDSYNQIKEQTRQSNAGTATGIIESVFQFAHSLRTSSASPLSAQDQYALAQTDFLDLATNIGLYGRADDIASFTAYATDFLNASRNIYGSGASYVADYNKVLEIIESIGNINADTLTASVYAEEAKKNTDRLVEAIAALKAEVVNLRRDQAQSAAAPVRVTV